MLEEASSDSQVGGVVLVHSWPWKSVREFNSVGSKTRGHYDDPSSKQLEQERQRISSLVESLSFNKQRGGKFLVLISGDIHMVNYSKGGKASNPDGSFPVFQCAPLAKQSSCSDD